MSTSTNFEQVLVKCIDTDKDVKADVLAKSDKAIHVVPVGSKASLVLNRTDTKKVYVTRAYGFEFTTDGVIL